MTRTQSQETKWQAFFQQERSTLMEIAEILLYRNGCPEDILQTALGESCSSPFYQPSVTATRAIVKAAIAHNYQFTDSWIATASSGPVPYELYGPLPLEALPWAERAVYFLREVLGYSVRDTALLLGTSDSNVDQLNRLAAKRMGLHIHPVAHSDAPRTTGPRAGRYAHSMPFAAFE